MAPVLAGALALTLTACGGNGGQAGTTPGNGTGAGVGSANGSLQNGNVSTPDADGSYAGSGNLQNESMGAPGTSAAGSGTAGTSTSRTRSQGVYDGYTATRRTAYDYLHDGQYAADGEGQVNGSWDPAARDFTQGARTMVRGAGEMVGGAVSDVGRGIQDITGR